MILEFSQLGFIGKKSVGFIYFSEIIVNLGILDSLFIYFYFKVIFILWKCIAIEEIQLREMM